MLAPLFRLTQGGSIVRCPAQILYVCVARWHWRRTPPAQARPIISLLCCALLYPYSWFRRARSPHMPPLLQSYSGVLLLCCNQYAHVMLLTYLWHGQHAVPSDGRDSLCTALQLSCHGHLPLRLSSHTLNHGSFAIRRQYPVAWSDSGPLACL